MNGDQQKAFSLVEWLATLALVLTLVNLAMPSFASWMESRRQAIALDLLTQYIQKTRAKAVLFGRPHRLCGSSDGEACDGDWAGYWLITTTGSDATLLRQQQAPTKNLCWSGFSSDSIHFHPNGTSWKSNGTFSFCNANGPHRQLILNRQGRLKHDSGHKSKCC